MSGDRFLLRIKDVVLLIGAVGGLLVGLGKIFALAEAVRENKERIGIVEPIVSAHTTQLAVINAQYDEIQNELKRISRKLDR